MIYYEVVMITINVLKLAEVIINIVARHYSFLKLIISDRNSIFTLKFWFLLCYFFHIKYRPPTEFHLQTHGQIEKENNMMEVYLRAFVN